MTLPSNPSTWPSTWRLDHYETKAEMLRGVDKHPPSPQTTSQVYVGGAWGLWCRITVQYREKDRLVTVPGCKSILMMENTHSKKQAKRCNNQWPCCTLTTKIPYTVSFSLIFCHFHVSINSSCTSAIYMDNDYELVATSQHLCMGTVQGISTLANPSMLWTKKREKMAANRTKAPSGIPTLTIFWIHWWGLNRA